MVEQVGLGVGQLVHEVLLAFGEIQQVAKTHVNEVKTCGKVGDGISVVFGGSLEISHILRHLL